MSQNLETNQAWARVAANLPEATKQSMRYHSLEAHDLTAFRENALHTAEVIKRYANLDIQALLGETPTVTVSAISSASGKEAEQRSLVPLATRVWLCEDIAGELPVSPLASLGVAQAPAHLQPIEGIQLTKLTTPTGASALMMSATMRVAVQGIADVHRLCMLLEEIDALEADQRNHPLVVARYSALQSHLEEVLRRPRVRAAVFADYSATSSGDSVRFLRTFSAWLVPGVAKSVPWTVESITKSIVWDSSTPLSRDSAKKLRNSQGMFKDVPAHISHTAYAMDPIDLSPSTALLKGQCHPWVAAVFLRYGEQAFESLPSVFADTFLRIGKTSPLTKLKRALQLADKSEGRFPCLMGGSGIGKSKSVQQLALELQQSSKGASFFSYGCSSHTTASAVIGSIVPIVVEGSHRYMWSDGPAARAFKSAAEGKKTILFLDELNRADPSEMSWLIPLLTPHQGHYHLPLQEAELNADGSPVMRVIKAPIDNLLIVGAMNVGAKFDVATLDQALQSRIIPVYIPYKVADLISTMSFDMGLGESMARAWGAIMEALEPAAREGRIARELNLRDVASYQRFVNEMLAQTPGLTPVEAVCAVMQLIPDFIEFDYQGTPNSEQHAVFTASIDTALSASNSAKDLQELKSLAEDVLDSML